jgi:hypothetical protein
MRGIAEGVWRLFEMLAAVRDRLEPRQFVLEISTPKILVHFSGAKAGPR